MADDLTAGLTEAGTLMTTPEERKKLGIAATIMFVVLLAFFGPSMIPSTSIGDRAMCQSQLKQIDSAKAEWARAQHKSPDVVPTWADLVPSEYMKSPPQCPRRGVYEIGSVGVLPRCSVARHTWASR
jgi:hypothetical protein